MMNREQMVKQDMERAYEAAIELFEVYGDSDAVDQAMAFMAEIGEAREKGVEAMYKALRHTIREFIMEVVENG